MKHETEAGTEETKVVTTPFADDFNLISNDKIKHQKLITVSVSVSVFRVIITRTNE